MNNLLQDSILSKISRFSFGTKFPFPYKKKQFFRIDKQKKETLLVEQLEFENENSPVLPNPALVLPDGILPILTFQNLVRQELIEISTNQHQSFVLQLDLIKKNCSFLTETAQKILALDALKSLLTREYADAHLAFSPTGKLWILLPNLDPHSATNQAKSVFNCIRKILREELDISLPLLELNMFKVDEQMPVIQ